MKCGYCNKELPSNTDSKRPFCSDDCLNAYVSSMTHRKGRCTICGKPLTGRQRSYCSSECRIKAQANYEYTYDKDQYKKPKAEPKKKGRPKKVPTITEINAKAKALGLTYGQYVGRYGM